MPSWNWALQDSNYQGKKRDVIRHQGRSEAKGAWRAHTWPFSLLSMPYCCHLGTTDHFKENLTLCHCVLKLMPKSSTNGEPLPLHLPQNLHKGTGPKALCNLGFQILKAPSSPTHFPVSSCTLLVVFSANLGLLSGFSHHTFLCQQRPTSSTGCGLFTSAKHFGLSSLCLLVFTTKFPQALPQQLPIRSPCICPLM